MNNDPNTYFLNLQQIATEQDRAKFATLTARFDSTLERLPKIREEIDAFLTSEQTLDYISLMHRIEPQLEQAEAFLIKLVTLPADLKNDDEIIAFAQTTSSALTLGHLLGVEDRLQALCIRVRERLEAEKRKQVEEEAKRKQAKEETKRKQAEEDAKRKQAEENAKEEAKEEAKRKQAEEDAKRKQAEENAKEEAKRKQAEEEAKRKQAEGEIEFWCWTGLVFGVAIGVLLIGWAFKMAEWWKNGSEFGSVIGILLGLGYIGSEIKEAEKSDFILAGIFGGIIGAIIGGGFGWVVWGAIGGGIGWPIGKMLHKWKNG